MNTRFWYGHCLKIGIVLAATSGYICSQRAIAQIVPDRTLGVESSIVTPVDIKGVPSDRIDAGAIRGANLFHSFQEFNIRDGRGAYFSNPAGIENIFSRVTGTNASNIFGKLGVLGNANLFLLNPNGIIFGPNAKLDIAGSFSASTGNSFNFGDAKFSATNPTDAPLLSVKVPLGVQFNQNQPSAIANSGNLSVGTGQNLNLMGGTVVSTGQLSAPSGQVVVASVPGGSVVNLSPSAQLLNIETSSPVASVGSSSLSELVTSVDERSRPGLTVNSNGQVELTGSGLPVVDGDVVARNVTAQTATLTANNNLTLVESQLGTTGDLNLLAGNTVRVRDSVANPFVAQAGGNLTIRGNQGIDILALNHPQTPFVSGGNLSLLSNGIISGDAHFASGGNFSILNLSGSGGNFVSLYDPIIRSNGDVVIGTYSGASLKIESAGNITAGAITINSPDTSAVGDPDSAILTGSRALILRSGLGTLSGNLPQPNLVGDVPQASVNYPTRSSAGNLTIGNVISDFGGPLTVILEANGNIGSISTTDINSTVFSGDGGNISITANGDITTGILTSFVDRNGQGNAGYIQITSNTGNITIGGNINSESSNGVAGNVTLTAAGDIRTRNIEASSNTDDQGFSTIRLESLQGSVFLNGATLSTTNTGTDNAGDIFINGRNIQIDNSSRIESQGELGRIFIGTGTVTENLTIRDNSVVSTTNNGNTLAGDIYINGNNIQITNTGRGNNQGIQSRGVNGRVFIGIDDEGNVTANNVTIRNSRVDTQTMNGVTSSLTPSEGDGIQIESLVNIEINNSILTAATNSEAPSGSISLNAVGSVNIRNNSTVSIRVNENATSPQQQINFTPTISLNGSSVNITDSTQVSASTFNSSRNAGDVIVSGSSVLLSGRGRNDPPTGLFAQVQSNQEGGSAGNLIITTDELRIENGAIATVSSPQGQAGNLRIFAKTISLNQGILRATTGREGDGANILLQGLGGMSPLNLRDLLTIGGTPPDSPLDFLHLQNESLIAANASSSTTGGNITINTRLLLALPPTGPRGSDITANAAQGRGGEVRITARPLGIYGIEFRPKNTSSNDFTASSQTGPAGIVSLRLPDVDPRRGLLQLPEDLGDSSRFIQSSCPVGGQRARSRFVVTGRGGLPPSPGSVLNSDILLGESGAIATPPKNNSPTPIVEAQGVEIGPKGEIILAANPSQLTSSYSPWQRFIRGCYGK